MARGKPVSFKGLPDIGHWPMVHWPTIRAPGTPGLFPSFSSFSPSALVRPPANRLPRNLSPGRRTSAHVRQPLLHRLRHRTTARSADTVRRIDGQRCAVDQEANGCAIWIAVIGGEQHRLLCRLGFAPGAVREKAIVAVGPQMRIKRFDALLGSIPAPQLSSLARATSRGARAIRFQVSGLAGGRTRSRS